MPQNIVIPVGAVAHIPVHFNWVHAMPPVDPTDKHASIVVPKDVRAEVDDESKIVTAEMAENGTILNIAALEPGSATVRVRAGSAEEVINVTSHVPTPNGLSVDVAAARFDLGGVERPSFERKPAPLAEHAPSHGGGTGGQQPAAETKPQHGGTATPAPARDAAKP